MFVCSSVTGRVSGKYSQFIPDERTSMFARLCREGQNFIRFTKDYTAKIKRELSVMGLGVI